MSRLRATLARSVIDRDLHTHLGRAVTAVRSAMDVCVRATRGQRSSSEGSYRGRQKQLARAADLLSNLGHLEESSETPDMQLEARALCSWLESRERSAGVRRPSRRGREYQSRLQQVLRFLSGGETSSEGEPGSKPEKKVTPDTPKPDQDSEGVLWERALELAHQEGKADDYAYVSAIFIRLAGGVTNG